MQQLAKSSVAVIALATLVSSGSSFAQGDWEWKADLQGSYGSYQGSTLRDDVSSVGALLGGDYLDSGGFTVGYNYTVVRLKAPTDDIKQNNLFLSGRLNFTPDALPGRLTGRLDVHFANNDDPTGNTDEVTVIAPQISFLSYDKNLYLDLGYARSNYQNDLDLDQWTPTVGIGMNQGADWLQGRVYYIRSSNSARSQGKSQTTALEAKYTHYFGPNGPLALSNVQLGGLFGERIYAVDGDAGVLYNLADLQKGSLTFGGQWAFSESSHLLLMGGVEKYRNEIISDSYNNVFVYLNYSSQF